MIYDSKNTPTSTFVQAGPRRLLMISIDRKIFEEGSMVRARQIEYAKNWEEVHIIVAADTSFSEFHIAPNIWVYPSRYAFKVFYPFAAIRLGRFIISKRGITNITCQDPFLTAMSGVALKKEFKIPLELQIHTDVGSPNYGFTLLNKVRKWLALSYIPKADTFRVASERIKKYLVEKFGIDSSKVEVRPIFVDTEKIKNAPITVDLHEKYPQFEQIVLMASRLEPEKDIRLAIDSWPLVLCNKPHAGLVIVGNGTQIQKIKAEGRRLGLMDSLAFEPWAEAATLASYYKTADAFLSTSLYEGYGMTLVEARAAGCAVVSTDVGVAREIGAIIVDHTLESVADGVIDALKK